MKPLGSLAAIAILALLGAGPTRSEDALPSDNDFILRAPASEAAAIASRNGLAIVSQVATAVDADGHSIFLARASANADPQTVISDIETFEPEVEGIERAVLARLPKLDQSAAMILDTSAVDSALGAISGFAPPTATVSATWNGHLHDREIEAGKTERLEFQFEHPADTALSGYALEIAFADGSSADFDPTSCVAILEPRLEVSGGVGKWRLVNTSASTITVDSVSVDWPIGNGPLLEVKLGSSVIFALSLTPPSATVDSLWIGSVSNRQLTPGSTTELRLQWLGSADVDPLAYSLSIGTAEEHVANFDPAGGPCASHVSDAVTVSDNRVQFDVTNHGIDDLIMDSATLTWPEANGKLMIAELHDDSILDAPYRHFGKKPDGSDRLVWTGYLNQPATVRLELDEAQKVFRGDATVAIIDTGIDPTHELLADNIVPGYDFVNDIPGSASEWADLDQSAAMILDQSAAMILDQSAAMILDQSAAMILDQSAAMILDTSVIPPAFGHGTMVAGVVHRTAPEAKLMPLKTFDANGNAHLYDIIEAIYFAVDHGANVINMSFNMETFSPALMRAINYAARHGVACVASAGNLGQEMLVFPAALGNTLGVAATSDADELSAFSNWGSDLVTIAAPGENIVTTYPGSRFAVASGTSFSAPWVSGGAAIFADKLGSKSAPGLADYFLVSNALAEADTVAGDGSGKCGYGRANLRRALDKVKSGRYANTRPLGSYTITATFAEGCSASYPPASSAGPCTADGASQLKFDGKKVLWDITNKSETEITLDSISIAWESDNGDLRKIDLAGHELSNSVVAPPSFGVGSGSLGALEDRVFRPHETLRLRFEFDHDAIWTY